MALYYCVHFQLAVFPIHCVLLSNTISNSNKSTARHSEITRAPSALIPPNGPDSKRSDVNESGDGDSAISI